MRAWSLQQALQICSELTTVIVPVAGPAPEAGSSHLVTKAEAGLASVASWVQYAVARKLIQTPGSLPAMARLAPPALAEQIATLSGAEDETFRGFDGVFCFRLYLAGVLVPAIEAGLKGQHRPRLLLDADEMDHRVLDHIAQLQSQAGEHRRSAAYNAQARASESFAGALLPLLDSVTLSSEQELNHLRETAAPERTACLPNVFSRNLVSDALHEGMPHTRDPKGRPTFLFVGNLDYWPNRDGLGWLLEDIWPAVINKMPEAQLRIIGAGADRLSKMHAQTTGLQWLGWVDKLPTQYRAASACLVPLRAGGGTRIKVLEAFENRTPLVGTTLGLEGLGIEHNRHALIADCAKAFAESMCMLFTQPALGQALAKSAYAHLDQHFRPTVFNAEMTTLLNEVLAQ